MGARWYNGADAAFRSRDSVFGELTTPISLNRYTYAWATPLMYWDPDGHYIDNPGDVTMDSDGNRTYHGDGYTKAEKQQKVKDRMPWEFEPEPEVYNWYAEAQAAIAEARAEATNPTPPTLSAGVMTSAIYMQCTKWNRCDEATLQYLDLVFDGMDPTQANTIANYMSGRGSSTGFDCDEFNAVGAFVCGGVLSPVEGIVYAIMFYDEVWEGLEKEYHDSGVAGATWNLTAGGFAACVSDVASPGSTAAQRGEASACLIETAIAVRGLSKLGSYARHKLDDYATNGAGLADDVARVGDDAFTHGYDYHPRIRERGIQDPVGHNFPYSYDDVILRSTPVTQADGSLLYRVPGSINTKDGLFEIALNPDTQTIFHRTFVGG
ncbi:MAG: hypothetical protein GY788_12320 [bacterium]|nr:hypothetical protein [bacterium]